MFIEYWNNPNMIFFLIALFVAMMCYSSAILWKRARLYEVAYTLGTARRQPIKPVVSRLVAYDVLSLAAIVAITFALPRYAILWNFIIIFITSVVLARMHTLYGLHLLDKYGFTSKRVSQNFRILRTSNHRRRTYFFIISLALLIFAVMEPYGKEKTTDLQRNDLRTTIAFDLSRSMDATDYVPTRFDAARDETIRLLNSSYGDQIGFVFFTHEVVAKIPQTLDASFLVAVLNEMDPSELNARGTDLNIALTAAMSTFDERVDNPNELPDDHRKRILLITDGEDHSDDIEQTIQKLIARHIHVDIIAVGTENGSEILDAKKSPMQYENAPVISRIQTAFLEDIANRTQGYFTRLTSPNSATSQILSKWNLVRIDMTPQEEASAYYREPLHGFFLAAAFIFMLLFFFSPVFIYMTKRLFNYRRSNQKRPENDDVFEHIS